MFFIGVQTHSQETALLEIQRKKLYSIVPFVLYSYIIGCDIILAYQRTPIYLKHSLFAVMNVIRSKEKL